MSVTARFLLCAVCFITCFLPAAAAQDILRFRGSGADSFYTDPSLNPTALKSGAKIVWQAAVKQGFSGIALKGNRLYTMGNDRANDTVWCLDAASGKVVWSHSYPCGSNEHPGPRATPAVDGNVVYTMSLEGHIFALDSGSGRVLWQKHAVNDFGSGSPSWALASSVVVDGDSLYININRHGVRLNKKTGAKIWASPAGDPGYATPVLFTAGGKKMGAFFGSDGLYGVDLASGKVAWRQDWMTSYQVNAADPLVFDDKIFISSGYGKGCALYRFTATSLKELWRNTNLAAHFSTPVFMNGSIFGITDNSGEGGRFRALKAASGAVTLNQPAQFGNFAVVNGKYFLIAFERGEIAVAEVTATSYTLRSSAKLKPATYWTAPAVSAGRAFIRNQRGDLFCLDMK